MASWTITFVIKRFLFQNAIDFMPTQLSFCVHKLYLTFVRLKDRSRYSYDDIHGLYSLKLDKYINIHSTIWNPHGYIASAFVSTFVSACWFNVNISWKMCVFHQKMEYYPNDGLNLISNEQYKCSVFIEC